MAKEEQYKRCADCGKALERKVKGVIGYDRRTGGAISACDLVCPDKRWYNFHDSIKGQLRNGTWEDLMRGGP